MTFVWRACSLALAALALGHARVSDSSMGLPTLDRFAIRGCSCRQDEWGWQPPLQLTFTQDAAAQAADFS